MPPDPRKYVGFVERAAPGLEVAGCITIVAGLDTEAVVRAFGADPDDPLVLDERSYDEEAVGIAPVRADVHVAVEDNGFQGNRPEVLGPASLGGRAASIFWNVDSMVMFACAQDGRVLSHFEFGLYDGGLPPELEPLRQWAESEEPGEGDMVAAGLAMVEAFTGVEVGASDLGRARQHGYRITPVLPEPVQGRFELHRDDEALAEAILAASPPTQRRLAEWAVRTAADLAGLTDDPAVRDVTDQLGGSRPPAMSARATALVKEMYRRADEIDLWLDELMSDEEFGPTQVYLAQAGRCLSDALRHVCLDDDLAAAMGAVRAAGYAATPGKEQVLAQAAQLLRQDPATWPPRATGLPAPGQGIHWERPTYQYADSESAEWDEVVLGLGDPWSERLASLAPELVQSLTFCSPEVQRRVARWAARQAAQEGGVQESAAELDDPFQAACLAIWLAVEAFGPDHPILLHQLRQEFRL